MSGREENGICRKVGVRGGDDKKGKHEGSCNPALTTSCFAPYPLHPRPLPLSLPGQCTCPGSQEELGVGRLGEAGLTAHSLMLLLAEVFLHDHITARPRGSQYKEICYSTLKKKNGGKKNWLPVLWWEWDPQAYRSTSRGRGELGVCELVYNS